jgi:hypothetical protein
MTTVNPPKETPPQTIERLTAELCVARNIITSYEAAEKQASEDEIKIAEKMAFGLTRDQAVSVLQRQRDHDAAARQAAHATAGARNNRAATP